MIGEASLFGLYVPWVLLLAIGSVGSLWLTRRALAAAGVYRWVWHPALFDTALYVVLLYAADRVAALLQSSWT